MSKKVISKASQWPEICMKWRKIRKNFAEWWLSKDSKSDKDFNPYTVGIKKNQAGGIDSLNKNLKIITSIAKSSKSLEKC